MDEHSLNHTVQTRHAKASRPIFMGENFLKFHQITFDEPSTKSISAYGMVKDLKSLLGR